MNRTKGLYPAWLSVLGIAILLGLYTTFRLFTEGHVLFNANDVIVWSLPLGVYIFLALTSSGMTLLAAIPLVFGTEEFEPLVKRLIFLSIATLCGAFVSIALELGSIMKMIFFIFSPNFSSPIWWMGFIYTVELIVLLLKFRKIHVGDWHSGLSSFLGFVSFILALIAPLMIGSVFGITESRVSYFGPVMSIYCLLMALLSGLALFILYCMILKIITGDGEIEKQTQIYDKFTLIFTYMAGIVIVFTLVKFAIESATVIPEFLVYHKFEHAFGAWRGFHVEVIFGLFLPFALLMISSIRNSIVGKIITSALIFVGTLMMHMEILLAGQSRPVGPKAEQFPAFIKYFPSIWEWSVFLFAVAIMLLFYTLGERYLKLGQKPA